jgi:hypothetical protein
MSIKQQIHIKFWGVRGSYPVPGTGTVSIGGNTACVEVQVNGQTIILDAGTGIIGLGRSLMARVRQTGSALEAIILFSHLHHDHIQGFPFFSPAYSPGARLHFFGPASFEKSLDMVLAQNQMTPMFPVTIQEMASTKDIPMPIQGVCCPTASSMAASRSSMPPILKAMWEPTAGWWPLLEAPMCSSMMPSLPKSTIEGSATGFHRRRGTGIPPRRWPVRSPPQPVSGSWYSSITIQATMMRPSAGSRPWPNHCFLTRAPPARG